MLETLWEQSDAFERWSKEVELGFGQPNVWKMGAPNIFHGSVGCLSKIGSCEKKGLTWSDLDLLIRELTINNEASPWF